MAAKGANIAVKGGVSVGGALRQGACNGSGTATCFGSISMGR